MMCRNLSVCTIFLLVVAAICGILMSFQTDNVPISFRDADGYDSSGDILRSCDRHLSIGAFIFIDLISDGMFRWKPVVADFYERLFIFAVLMLPALTTVLYPNRQLLFICTRAIRFSGCIVAILHICERLYPRIFKLKLILMSQFFNSAGCITAVLCLLITSKWMPILTAVLFAVGQLLYITVFANWVLDVNILRKGVYNMNRRQLYVFLYSGSLLIVNLAILTANARHLDPRSGTQSYGRDALIFEYAFCCFSIFVAIAPGRIARTAFEEEARVCTQMMNKMSFLCFEVLSPIQTVHSRLELLGWHIKKLLGRFSHKLLKDIDDIRACCRAAVVLLADMVHSGSIDIVSFTLERKYESIAFLSHIRKSIKSSGINLKFINQFSRVEQRGTAVLVDKMMMQQVVTDLVILWIKATPNGGTVTVSIKKTRAEDSQSENPLHSVQRRMNDPSDSIPLFARGFQLFRQIFGYLMTGTWVINPAGTNLRRVLPSGSSVVVPLQGEPHIPISSNYINAGGLEIEISDGTFGTPDSERNQNFESFGRFNLFAHGSVRPTEDTSSRDLNGIADSSFLAAHSQGSLQSPQSTDGRNNRNGIEDLGELGGHVNAGAVAPQDSPDEENVCDFRVTHEIIRLNGGSIKYQSARNGIGASLSVCLPRFEIVGQNLDSSVRSSSSSSSEISMSLENIMREMMGETSSHVTKEGSVHIPRSRHGSFMLQPIGNGNGHNGNTVAGIHSVVVPVVPVVGGDLLGGPPAVSTSIAPHGVIVAIAHPRSDREVLRMPALMSMSTEAPSTRQMSNRTRNTENHSERIASDRRAQFDTTRSIAVIEEDFDMMDYSQGGSSSVVVNPRVAGIQQSSLANGSSIGQSNLQQKELQLRAPDGVSAGAAVGGAVGGGASGACVCNGGGALVAGDSAMNATRPHASMEIAASDHIVNVLELGYGFGPGPEWALSSRLSEESHSYRSRGGLKSDELSSHHTLRQSYLRKDASSSQSGAPDNVSKPNAEKRKLVVVRALIVTDSTVKRKLMCHCFARLAAVDGSISKSKIVQVELTDVDTIGVAVHLVKQKMVDRARRQESIPSVNPRLESLATMSESAPANTAAEKDMSPYPRATRMRSIRFDSSSDSGSNRHSDGSAAGSSNSNRHSVESAPAGLEAASSDSMGLTNDSPSSAVVVIHSDREETVARSAMHAVATDVGLAADIGPKPVSENAVNELIGGSNKQASNFKGLTASKPLHSLETSEVVENGSKSKSTKKSHSNAIETARRLALQHFADSTYLQISQQREDEMYDVVFMDTILGVANSSSIATRSLREMGFTGLIIAVCPGEFEGSTVVKDFHQAGANHVLSGHLDIQNLRDILRALLHQAESLDGVVKSPGILG